MEEDLDGDMEGGGGEEEVEDFDGDRAQEEEEALDGETEGEVVDLDGDTEGEGIPFGCLFSSSLEVKANKENVS